MKMKYTKILALILAVTLAVSLGACAKAKPPAGAGAVIDPKAKPAIVKGETVGAAAKGLDENMTGTKEKIALPKYVMSSNKVVMLSVSDDGQHDLFTKEYGGVIEYVVTSHEEYQNKLVSLVMSDQSPDGFSSAFQPNLIKKDLVQPIDSLFDFTMPLWAGLKKSLDQYKWNGNYYMVSPIFGRWSVVWYNRTIFADNGIDTPDTYLEKGEWTWSKLREVSKALTIDADQNGTPEIWGIAIDDLGMFISSTGKSFVTFNSDGTATNNIKSPEIASAIKFYADLYNKDKCVYKGDDGRDRFMQDQIAMIAGGLWYRVPFKEKMKVDSICFVPYPKSDSADKYYCPESSDGVFIPKGAKNPAGAAALISAKRFMYVDEYWLNWDKENVAKDCYWNDDDQNMIWNWVQNSAKLTPVPNLAQTFGVDQLNGDIYARTRDGEPWATIAEEISPKIDNNIAKALEK